MEITVAHTYYNDLTKKFYVCNHFAALGSFQYACCFFDEYNKTHQGKEKIHIINDEETAKKYVQRLINQAANSLKN